MSDPIDPSQVQWGAAPAPAGAIDPSQVKWDDASTTTTPPQRSLGSQLVHEGAQTLKAGANAVAALPLAAMDAGVGARNVLGDAYNRAIGNPATPDYELPSTTWHRGMNEVFGAPENTVEKVNDVVLPMAMGAMGASESAPSAVRAIMGGPESSDQVPSNFVNPEDSKGQILAQTVKKAQDLGLVAPPQTTNPNAANATIETIGGKIATQQAASVHNQPIANSIAARELGLNPDTPLTENGIRQVIGQAGKAYQALRGAGQITIDDPYLNTLSDVAAEASGPAASFPGSKVSPLTGEVDSMLQPSFDASHAVDKIAELRDSSSMAYRTGDTRLGMGYRKLANALEDQIDRGISQNPNVSPDLVSNFRSSRVLAAKAHSVLDALNPATGDVSIQSLAKSGDPLSGDLKTLADFGNAVPRATQDVSKIGSHGVSHLDVLGPLLGGAIGEHAMGPWGTAVAAAYPTARWAAKSYALGPGQSGAIPSITTGGVGAPKAAAAATQAIENSGIQRASGGKVDIDSLVNRLIERWKDAKKETDHSTSKLLRVPDATIAKALDIAGRAI
jgi:hypothetical protein